MSKEKVKKDLTPGSPAWIRRDRAERARQAAAEEKREAGARTLRQEVYGGRRGAELLSDVLERCFLWSPIRDTYQLGKRDFALGELGRLGVLTPDNLLSIARYMLRLPVATRGRKAREIPPAESAERAIRIGLGGVIPTSDP